MNKLWIASAGLLALAACTSVGSTSSSIPSPARVTPKPVITAPLTPSPSSPLSSPIRHSTCNPKLWLHIYHPYRLHVVSACKTITGTVEGVRQEPDGDLHILLRPDPAYAGLINSANTQYEHGDLVLEAICVGSVTQADAVAVCSLPFSPPRLPEVSVGEHIKVTGSYVLDADHGWMEIHPISKLVILAAPTGQ